jgi:hypothetical protein
MVRVRRGPPHGPSLGCVPRQFAGRSLQLHDAYTVLAWVDEPCHPSKPNVRDSAFGLEAREVVFLNLDTSGSQRSQLLLKVGDAPGSLSLLILCSDCALGNRELVPTSALEGDGAGGLCDDLKSNLSR